jgi:Protein of unknown function (DUF1569)
MNQDLALPEAKANLIARISKLNAGTPAKWGKMNVSQMLAHCQAQLRVALGDEKLKHSFMGMLFGSWAKKKLLEEKPFSKGLPTAPSFLIKHNPDFETEKNNLIGMITRFNAVNITKDPHPFFGKMTIEEWSTGTWKHLDHHLKQFGV